jgi:hypothetical protein
MTATEPTVLATSGGHRVGDRTWLTFDALVHHAVELSGVHGRRPRVMYVGTAIGDAEHFAARMSEAARVAGFDLTPLRLFLPYGNGVRYDTDPGRRPLVHRLVAEGTLPLSHCTDDGVGLVYRGTELVDTVSETPGKGAYVVRREGDRAVEERVEPRLLPAPRH